MEIAKKINFPARNYWSMFHHYLEHNHRYFNMYRVRALIWSFFTPIIMFIPAYLFIVTFDQFNFASIMQFLLACITFVTWTAFPGVFLYVNSERNKASEIWFWVWLALAPVSLIVWMVVLN